MSAIDKVRAHFDALAKRTIDVPEWDLVIHSSPVTIADRKRIYNGLGDDTQTALVRVLIVKAKGPDGVALFSIADEPHLLNHADPAIVYRVAGEILNNEAPSAKELGN